MQEEPLWDESESCYLRKDLALLCGNSVVFAFCFFSVVLFSEIWPITQIRSVRGKTGKQRFECLSGNTVFPWIFKLSIKGEGVLGIMKDIVCILTPHRIEHDQPVFFPTCTLHRVYLLDWATVRVLWLQRMSSNSLSVTFLGFLSDQSPYAAPPLTAAGPNPLSCSLDVEENKGELEKDRQRRVRGKGKWDERRRAQREAILWGHVWWELWIPNW